MCVAYTVIKRASVSHPLSPINMTEEEAKTLFGKDWDKMVFSEQDRTTPVMNKGLLWLPALRLA